MKRSHPRRFVPFVALVLGLADSSGCGDDDVSDPVLTADIVAAATAVNDQLSRMVQANDVLGTTEALRDFITQITAQPSPPIAPVSYDYAEAWRAQLYSGGVPLSGETNASVALSTATIPDALLGATCVWSQRGYIDDPSREGAPLNGIRFILYTIDPGTRLPALPLVELGLIDIVDLSAGSSIDVSLVALDGDSAPRVDYGINGVLDSNFNLTSTGFLSDGTDKLNFDLRVVGSLSTGFQASLTSPLDAYTLEITLSETPDPSGATQSSTTVVTGSLRSTQGSDVIAFTIRFDGLGVVQDGSVVTVNGRTVATFQGSDGSLVLAPTQDSPLSSMQFQSLIALVDGMEALFLAFGELFDFGLENTGSSLPS